ncbi:hypothetical protein M407DRAFT_81249 [Tulasnella calospora MUT 4182]|uniref:Uncharacterized protein n=1 Tax=Tulasnella calospora MUT 4182 TaxID=1051891 RepID=A0A0C3KGU1_9AGAM|nr:hypothetical protein M407DRAFT_81249 [Tulasnella calospora MUT 4182]
MVGIIVRKLGERKELVPVILPVVTEDSEEPFDVLIGSFRLSISLGTVIKRAEEWGVELRTSVRHDAKWHAMEFPDIGKKQFGGFGSIKS